VDWPWRSPKEAARRAAERDARFVRVGREAHERSRDQSGPQKLKPRNWDRSGPMDKAGAEAEQRRDAPLDRDTNPHACRPT